MSKCLKFCPAQGLKFKVDFHSKMNVCRHELVVQHPAIQTMNEGRYFFATVSRDSCQRPAIQALLAVGFGDLQSCLLVLFVADIVCLPAAVHGTRCDLGAGYTRAMTMPMRNMITLG